MIKRLKIPTNKALKEMTLQDLGKINVVCGKNNSGKTTFLEAISSKERKIGKPIDESVLASIYNQLSRLTSQYRSTNPRETLEQRIKRRLAETAKLKEIWFVDQKEVFVREANEGMGLAEFSELMGKIWDNLFKDGLNFTLLPPKRYLNPTQEIQSQGIPQSTGEGILNALFFAKNQDGNSELKKNYVTISNAFTDISAGYTFDIFSLPNNKIGLFFALKDRPFVPAMDCGLGLQDLLVILFFSIKPEYHIILIEEPESHLHPEMQKRLLAFLRDGTDKQFFLSTHSNVFLNNAYVDRVFFTSFKESVIVDDATSKASMLDDLGYSVADNLVSDVIILVEGPSDVAIIEEFLIKLGLDKNYNIKMWPLGGDIRDQLDLSVLAQSYSIIAIVDNDPGSDKIRKRFIKNCKEHGIPVHRLQKYAIENYFSLEALRQIFSNQIPADITEIKSDQKLEDQIGINVKRNNRRIARAMSYDDIKDTDLEKFFTKVRELCKRPKS